MRTPSLKARNVSRGKASTASSDETRGRSRKRSASVSARRQCSTIFTLITDVQRRSKETRRRLTNCSRSSSAVRSLGKACPAQASNSGPSIRPSTDSNGRATNATAKLGNTRAWRGAGMPVLLSIILTGLLEESAACGSHQALTHPLRLGSRKSGLFFTALTLAVPRDSPYPCGLNGAVAPIIFAMTQ
ncbi:hypothetical protein D3C86_1242360 [compost metagenome]